MERVGMLSAACKSRTMSTHVCKNQFRSYLSATGDISSDNVNRLQCLGCVNLLIRQVKCDIKEIEENILQTGRLEGDGILNSGILKKQMKGLPKSKFSENENKNRRTASSKFKWQRKNHEIVSQNDKIIQKPDQTTKNDRTANILVDKENGNNSCMKKNNLYEPSRTKTNSYRDFNTFYLPAAKRRKTDSGANKYYSDRKQNQSEEHLSSNERKYRSS